MLFADITHFNVNSFSHAKLSIFLCHGGSMLAAAASQAPEGNVPSALQICCQQMSHNKTVIQVLNAKSMD